MTKLLQVSLRRDAEVFETGVSRHLPVVDLHRTLLASPRARHRQNPAPLVRRVVPAGRPRPAGRGRHAAPARRESRILRDLLAGVFPPGRAGDSHRSEEHTSELQSPYVISYAV